MKKLNELGFGITISTKKYYWILYYSFLSLKTCENDQVVLAILQAHNFVEGEKKFYGRRRSAVYAFRILFEITGNLPGNRPKVTQPFS